MVTPRNKALERPLAASEFLWLALLSVAALWWSVFMRRAGSDATALTRGIASYVGAVCLLLVPGLSISSFLILFREGRNCCIVLSFIVSTAGIVALIILAYFRFRELSL